ncbi:dTDP-4-amino-4,6-dideoxy-D-galactose acyltransferase [Pantoea sp. 1.19]|uniref:dTDP-4-amino-4,6-dideoxy-D-galactose acyltransferase n=1 Tax=Pantoea sp. 1.19 TaxID=1925589 RepID=UPI000948D5CB|nr:dTDP-4-amino-4,6-dideoxy-D-galactose acyltransferase [Pantoea sp. 1.19]
MALTGTLTPLAWESEFFQRRTARLDSDPTQTLSVAALDAWPLVQAKRDASQTADIDALSALGFRLVEGEAELLLRPSVAERPAGIRVARTAQIPALREAAAAAFSHSRFRAPWFAADASARFYAQWIDNAVHGTFDHLCLLAIDAHGDLQGFVSLRETGPQAGRIGLLATLEGHQGKGVATRLLTAAQDWCLTRGIDQLRVATQLANLPALRLYLRCGATLERTAYWFYR